jgi:hypothetical protein
MYLKRIIHSNLSQSNSEIYVLLQNRQSILRSIDETVFSFVGTIYGHQLSEGLTILIQNSTESLHVNFVTALEATKSKNQLDSEILLQLTEDKGPLMEQIRRYHLSEKQDLSLDDKALLLDITDLFQRTVWLLNNWAKSIKPEPAD